MLHESILKLYRRLRLDGYRNVIFCVNNHCICHLTLLLPVPCFHSADRICILTRETIQNSTPAVPTCTLFTAEVLYETKTLNNIQAFNLNTRIRKHARLVISSGFVTMSFFWHLPIFHVTLRLTNNEPVFVPCTCTEINIIKNQLYWNISLSDLL